MNIHGEPSKEGEDGPVEIAVALEGEVQDMVAITVLVGTPPRRKFHPKLNRKPKIGEGREGNILVGE